jgi:hypothetical protein
MAGTVASAAGRVAEVVDDQALIALLNAIAAGDRPTARRLLQASPQLAVRPLAEGASRAAAPEYFLEACGVYAYAGHTALHVAAAAYDDELARELIAAGADLRARNRRGAEPLHEAVRGGPSSPGWDPARQTDVIGLLLTSGADPDAPAAGGVTPLQRAVRNRCAAAVRALLAAGADPHLKNDRGSTAMTLAGHTTGRGGTGSPEAKAEQAQIVAMLQVATGRP